MNTILGLGSQTMLLTDGHIFELNAQLINDVIIQAIAIFILFFFLSNVLFEPVKKVLANRTEKIKNDIESAAKDKEDAAALKAEYDEKLKAIEKEKEEILAEARKKAQKREADIVEEANAEAERIINRANQEIELEKSKVSDEMRKEIVRVATAMAAKILSQQIDESRQDALIEDTLKEMGGSTWLSR
ncbi:MAG: F0F1 ATP synthase subunit B [Bacteroidales bacterium]|nr:F0F1 ATP synthase subunit B [Clostridium sp.]MCM1203388.1 F0F1 ATP synthase subunit B [Bacteroidales bacterium]